jgi:ATP-binding cassette subfamily B protein
MRDRRDGTGGSGLMDVVAFSWRCWRPYRATGALLLALVFADKLFWIGFAYSLKFTTDRLGANGDPSAVLLVLAGMLAAFPAVVVVNVIGDRLTARVRARMANDVRVSLFEHLQRLSAAFYVRAQHGDLVARFAADLNAIERVVSERFLHAVAAVVAAAITVALLLTLNAPLTGAALALLALIASFARRLAPRLVAATHQRRRAEAQVITRVHEALRGQPVVRAFSLQAAMRRDFQARLAHLTARYVDSFFAQALLDKSFILAIVYVVLLTLAAAILLVARGALPAGAMVAFMVLLVALQKDLLMLTTHVVHMIEGTGGLRRIQELLAVAPEIVEAPAAPALPRFSREIRFEHVSFGYTAGRRHLEAIDLTIPAGAHVAVVGPSGAGKTTLLHLLLRAYDVTTGRITLDGHDLRAVSQASLRAQLSIVFQRAFLFDATLLENIRLFDAGVPRRDVEAAARAAGLHEVVAGLPEGYETVVGEDGGRLSEGERQRVAIARAILRDPAILLLDEVTASLDAETAAAVHRTVERLARARTVISVTHDLAQAARADAIVVLDGGRLAGYGRHEALLAGTPVYGRLWSERAWDASAGAPPRLSAGSHTRSSSTR